MMRIVLATVWCILGRWSLVIKPNFCSDFEHKVCSIFRSLVEILMFGWDFEVSAYSRFWNWNFIKICARSCDINSNLGSVVSLAMFPLLSAIQVSVCHKRKSIKMSVPYHDCWQMTPGYWRSSWFWMTPRWRTLQRWWTFLVCSRNQRWWNTVTQL